MSQITLEIYIIQLFNCSLITFVSLVFSFSAVYEWIRLTFIFILILFFILIVYPTIVYFEGFKAKF